MTKTIKAAPTVKPTATKDSGAVKIGGGCIRYSTKDSGAVKIGGGCMRF